MYLDRRSETNQKQNMLSSFHLNCKILTIHSQTDMAKLTPSLDLQIQAFSSHTV